MKIRLAERFEKKVPLGNVGSARRSDRQSARGTRYRLNRDDAAVIKGMLARGDSQHDIASYFGVNGGRIAEIAIREKFPRAPVSQGRLPPPGPYHIPELLARLLTANRRRATTRDEILDACAAVENRLAPDDVTELQPVLNKLWRCAVQLDRE